MGVMELVIIVCGGGLALVATVAIGYLFLKKNNQS
jgi:uncharacterized protein YneF (UPF0154 family)